MTIIVSNRWIERDLDRIARSLESIDETLKKLTADDFQSEDDTVKRMTSDVTAAAGRLPSDQVNP